MSSVIRASDLKHPHTVHDLLARRRDEIYMRIKELRRDQEAEAEPSPTDTMDAARATAEVETHASLISHAEDELRLIDEALERVEHGNYGICADCGEAIPLARLNSVPFTLYCVKCEETHDRSHRRWSDGGTIAPYDRTWALPDEMKPQKDYRVSTSVAGPAHHEETQESETRSPASSRAKPERRTK